MSDNEILGSGEWPGYVIYWEVVKITNLVKYYFNKSSVIDAVFKNWI